MSAANTLVRLAASTIIALSIASTLVAQPVPRGAQLRVLVRGKSSAESPAKAGLTTTLSHSKKVFEVRQREQIVAADLEWADALVIQDAWSATDDAAMTATIRSFTTVGGTALFTHEALQDLAKRPALAKLLAVREVLEKAKPVQLAIFVDQQNHSITQSMTHFLHRGPMPHVTLDPRASTLIRVVDTTSEAADAAKAGGPGIWLSRTGRGFVVASTLDQNAGPSSSLVAVLLARCLEWSKSRPVQVPLSQDFQLAAEKLGPDDTGILPGWKPQKGYFRGREIAPVMSYLGAAWLLRPDRADSEQPEKLIDSLSLPNDAVVADIGAGNGYFSLRFAKRLSKGKVLAVDIQPKMLDLLRVRMKREKVENIEPILCTETDPKLPAASVDLAIFVDVYHELEKPTPVMLALLKSLKKDGRVVLVEYRGEDPSVPIKPLHRMTIRQARAEMKAFGFHFHEVKNFLPHQHVLIFGKSPKK